MLQLASVFFSGSALERVDAGGRVHLPSFISETLARTSDRRTVMVGIHEISACLTGYDPRHSVTLHTELERRRLRDESEGLPDMVHHLRARRAFGLAEQATIDGRDRIRLPELIRRLGRIKDLALFVGTGVVFEVWDPELARSDRDEGLRDLADYWLENRMTREKEEQE